MAFLDTFAVDMRPSAAVCFALVLALVASTGDVAAQTAAPKPAGPPPPADPNAPLIAPPSPTASPQKVEEAKSTAQTAELTPIVPSPRDPLKPAFQLYAEIDLPVLGIGLVFANARRFRSQTAFCAPLCDPATLNDVDRTTAGYWSTNWQSASDYGLLAIGLGAATLLLVDEGVYPALNDMVVVAETALAATALASVMTLASSRPRPFLYGEEAPLDKRNSADGGLSFLSSHAAVSFAIATSTFMTMRRLHPRSNAPWIVMGVGGLAAAFVASARVLGGMHFISDSIGGAIVGTSLGILIPSLHASPVTVVPVAGDGQRGMALSFRF